MKPKTILLAIVAILLAGSFAAKAIFPNAAGTYGSPTIKLTEKFSLNFQSGTTGVAWSPDGSTLGVSSNYGMQLNTYDNAGHQNSSFLGNGNMGAYLNSFAFINGSSQVLFPIENSAKIDAAIDIRDAKTGHIVNTITRPLDAIYRPNGTSVVTVSSDQKRFAITNSAAPETILYGENNFNDWHELSVAKGDIKYASAGKKYWLSDTSLCFFADKKFVAIGKSEGHFAVVDSDTGVTLKEFHAYDEPGIHLNIDGLAVSPKGDLILTGLGHGSLTPDATHEAVAWQRNGEGLVSIWRISDGKNVASFSEPNKLIRQAIWDPQGRFVAFIDNDSLILWQSQLPGKNYIRIKLPGLSASLAVTRDGKELAVAGDKKVIVYNIQDK